MSVCYGYRNQTFSYQILVVKFLLACFLGKGFGGKNLRYIEQYCESDFFSY